jgi:predicted ferric reductase
MGSSNSARGHGRLGREAAHGVPKLRPHRIAFWLTAYAILAVAPLAVALFGPLPAPRAFLVEFGVGLGFLGIGILALQFVTSGRFQRIAPVIGADVVLQHHRQAGIIAFGLVLAHPAVLVLSDRKYLEFFDPTVNLLRALALSAVIPAALLLLVTSLWRQETRLRYEWWRAVHGVLSLAVVFIGMVHGIQVGHYVDGPVRIGLWAGVLGGAMYLVVHTRVIRPLRARRRPYEVVAVKPEASDVTTLELRPVCHEGMRYSSGQYAWITLGDTPFSLQQHPFSFVSGEDDPAIAFAAKALGDFTSTWPNVEVGTRVFLEGPFGGFTVDRCAPGAVFVVGGIGVTPAMSVLRTIRSRGDDRRVVLIYAVASLDDVPFAEEIRRMDEAMANLHVVWVPEEPPEDWTRASGLLDGDLIRSIVTPAELELEFFVCGPEPMMDAVESALRDLGVDWRRIYTERFQIV